MCRLTRAFAACIHEVVMQMEARAKLCVSCPTLTRISKEISGPVDWSELN